jgi:alpha-galactosidase
LIASGAPVLGRQTLIQVADATVMLDARGWTIGNSVIRYALGTTGDGVGIRAILDPHGGVAWHRSTGADTFVSVNGHRVTIGRAPTVLVAAGTSEWRGGVRLDLRYRLLALSLTITRSYACYPGSAVIETWTTFRSDGGQTVVLSDLTSYAFAIPNGTIGWVSGLHTPEDIGGAFTRFSRHLEDGQAFTLGSQTRASAQALPWFSVRAGDQEFFGSILWSGSWQFQSERRGNDLHVQLGLPALRTSLAPKATLETPHAILGFTSRALPEVSLALRGFIDTGLRRGRPLGSYVTYNTWYAQGVFVDEPSMLAEMEAAAGAGIEQFVLDAGWWDRSRRVDFSDFRTDWGNWRTDPVRFPRGLGVLADRAHELGMRFGLWVEPERVDRATVGQPSLASDRFLATENGRYDLGLPNDQLGPAQVCLADPEARAWLLLKIARLVHDSRPDYLKWDNNFWINCNRAGHGHGSEDGNLLHHRGLQLLLDELRSMFPALDIENCAGGGQRLSLDMLMRTDAAWMDDQTSPAVRVRHAVQGLFGLFPPTYLMSFVTIPIEAVGGGRLAAPPYVIRSRMLGSPGFSFRLADVDRRTRDEIAAEVALYKRLRAIQHGAAILLSQQVQTSAGSGWDAVQYLVPDGSEAVVLAFNGPDASPSAMVKLRGLRPEARFVLDSPDTGLLGVAGGRDLMERGIELEAAGVPHGRVIFLRAE